MCRLCFTQLNAAFPIPLQTRRLNSICCNERHICLSIALFYYRCQYPIMNLNCISAAATNCDFESMSTPNHDQDHLIRLQEYYGLNRRIPSYQRICALLGFTSKASAHMLLQRLEMAGYMQRADDGAWIPTGRFFECPLAQIPLDTDDSNKFDGKTAEAFLVNEYFLSNPARTVVVTVKDESMADAGIFDGDLVVVERTKTAKAGDFVIAIVDNEMMLTELAMDGEHTILKPRNPAYPIVRPKNKLKIFGIVTGLVRRYRS
jgi:SOS-response transcriptional repressor LexA